MRRTMSNASPHSFNRNGTILGDDDTDNISNRDPNWYKMLQNRASGSSPKFHFDQAEKQIEYNSIRIEKRQSILVMDSRRVSEIFSLDSFQSLSDASQSFNVVQSEKNLFNKKKSNKPPLNTIIAEKITSIKRLDSNDINMDVSEFEGNDNNTGSYFKRPSLAIASPKRLFKKQRRTEKGVFVKATRPSSPFLNSDNLSTEDSFSKQISQHKSLFKRRLGGQISYVDMIEPQVEELQQKENTQTKITNNPSNTRMSIPFNDVEDEIGGQKKILFNKKGASDRRKNLFLGAISYDKSDISSENLKTPEKKVSNRVSLRGGSIETKKSSDDEDGAKLTVAQFSPSSVISETLTYDKFKNLLSSTVIGEDSSPKTPLLKRTMRRLSKRLSPVRDEQSVAEELEDHNEVVHKNVIDEVLADDTKNKNSNKSVENLKNVTAVNSSNNRSMRKSIRLQNSKSETTTSKVDNSVEIIREVSKNNAMLPNVTKDELHKNILKPKQTASPRHTNIFPSHESFIENEELNSSNNRSLRKSRRLENSKNESKANNSLRIIRETEEKGETLHNINKNESHKNNLKRKQTTSLVDVPMEESDPNTDVLSQSAIDRAVIEEMKARRTNPPVRRSTIIVPRLEESSIETVGTAELQIFRPLRHSNIPILPINIEDDNETSVSLHSLHKSKVMEKEENNVSNIEEILKHNTSVSKITEKELSRLSVRNEKSVNDNQNDINDDKEISLRNTDVPEANGEKNVEKNNSIKETSQIPKSHVEERSEINIIEIEKNNSNAGVPEENPSNINLHNISNIVVEKNSSIHKERTKDFDNSLQLSVNDNLLNNSDKLLQSSRTSSETLIHQNKKEIDKDISNTVLQTSLNGIEKSLRNTESIKESVIENNMIFEEVVQTSESKEVKITSNKIDETSNNVLNVDPKVQLAVERIEEKRNDLNTSQVTETSISNKEVSIKEKAQVYIQNSITDKKLVGDNENKKNVDEVEIEPQVSDENQEIKILNDNLDLEANNVDNFKTNDHIVEKSIHSNEPEKTVEKMPNLDTEIDQMELVFDDDDVELNVDKLEASIKNADEAVEKLSDLQTLKSNENQDNNILVGADINNTNKENEIQKRDITKNVTANYTQRSVQDMEFTIYDKNISMNTVKGKLREISDSGRENEVKNNPANFQHNNRDESSDSDDSIDNVELFGDSPAKSSNMPLNVLDKSKSTLNRNDNPAPSSGIINNITPNETFISVAVGAKKETMRKSMFRKSLRLSKFASDTPPERTPFFNRDENYSPSVKEMLRNRFEPFNHSENSGSFNASSKQNSNVKNIYIEEHNDEPEYFPSPEPRNENVVQKNRIDVEFIKRLQEGVELSKKMDEENFQKFLNRPKLRVINDNWVVPQNINKFKTKSVKKQKRNLKKNTVNLLAPKKAKLYMKERWITKRLYEFLQRKMETKYGLDTKAKSEEFVIYLANIVNVVLKSKNNIHHNHILELKSKMAEENLIETHFDFHRFVDDYLPFLFRLRAVPGCGRDAPKIDGLFDKILIENM